jgi:hypothetical protein
MDIQHSSLQRRIFSQVPGPKCLEKCLTAHIHRIFNRFVTTGSVEKGKSSGRPKVMENVVENIRDHLEAHPRPYLLDCHIKLQYLHAIKLLEENMHLHPYNCTIAAP